MEASTVKAGDNSSERKAILKEAAEAILKKEAEKKALSEEISAIKSEKVKPHMKVSNFNAGLRLLRLQNGDGDDGEHLAKDSLREMLEAIESMGFSPQQMDLFQANVIPIKAAE